MRQSWINGWMDDEGVIDGGRDDDGRSDDRGMIDGGMINEGAMIKECSMEGQWKY